MDQTRLAHDFDPFDAVIGESPAIQSVIAMSQRLKNTTATLLLTGETGVGKEVFARAIHSLREGTDAPFIAINCSAIMASLVESELFGYEKGAFSGADPKGKPGKIALAKTGTLFLDEIGDMSPDLQVKLLRILEDREYYPVGGTRPHLSNCRFIAATNRNLAVQVENGKFREDLFYRLNVLSLEIPPLRNRSEDIPILANAFLRQFGSIEPIDAKIATVLANYSWPGNVRELRNAMERLCVLSSDGIPQADHLPPAVLSISANPVLSDGHHRENLLLPRQGTLPEWLADCERQFIEAALAETNDNKQAAAQRLGISRMTLYNKMGMLVERNPKG